MLNRKAKLIALALAGAGAYGVWTLGSCLLSSDDAEVDGTRNLVNQVWIDRMPQDPRDIVGHIVLVDHAQTGRMGVIGRASRWRQAFELFKWGLEGNRLSLFFPQDEIKAQARVRTWKCKGEAPEGFDLCMRLSSGRRSLTMYSREEWVVDPQDAEGSLAELVEANPEVAGVFEHVVFGDDDDRKRVETIDGEGYTEVDEIPLVQ